jgi:hypothetical protein
MNLHRILSTAAVATGAVLLSVGIQTFAYTAPTSAPTTIDADAPLNTGSATQQKNGRLIVNSGGTAPEILTVMGTSKTYGNIKLIDGSGIGLAVIAGRYCFGTGGATDIAPTNPAVDCITAWPTAMATSTFLNTTATPQTKSGALTLGGNLTLSDGTVTIDKAGTAVTALKINTGNLKIGNGTIAVDTIGLGLFGKSLKISDGTEGSGKVLTSNSGGVASWQDVTKISTKCGTAVNCVALPDGTMFQWGSLTATSGNRSTDGNAWVRTVTMDAAFASGTSWVVTVNPSGSSLQIYSQNCVAGTKNSGNNAAFYIYSDAYCDGVVYMWMAIGK